MSFSFASDGIEVLWISGREVERLLTFPLCIEAVAAAMVEVSAGNAELPLRRGMPLLNKKGMLGMMAGHLGKPDCFGVKLISLLPDNPKHGFPSHLGLYVLFEPEHGRPLAVMDANVITAIRTAAASAVATQALARADAKVLAILGTGEQAHAHLQALPLVRDLTEIRVWGRDLAKAQAVIDCQRRTVSARLTATDDLASAIAGADIICTLTAAKTPFFKGEWLHPGQHVNLVGSSVPTAAEVDGKTVAQSRFFVDYRPSTLDQAGEFLAALQAGLIKEDHIAGEIGAVLAGKIEGRRSPEEVTVYKSLGIAAQDLAAAWAVFQAAGAAGAGVRVAH